MATIPPVIVARKFPVGATALVEACRKGMPLYDPMQVENILNSSGSKSLPCFGTRLESMDDESSRSEDDEAPSRYEGPGKVFLRIAYNGEILRVHVLNCMGLPAHCLWTPRGPQYFRRTPFVSLSLLPESASDSRTSFETRARHRTLNPKFDEAFEFTIAPQDLRERALKILVFDREEGRSSKMLGMVVHPLDNVGAGYEQSLVLDLSQPEQSGKEEQEALQRRGSSPGDLFVGLTRDPHANRVRIDVLKMKGFRTSRSVRLSGSYMFARGDALSHWDNMMKSPGSTILNWHQLDDPSGFRAKSFLNRAAVRSFPQGTEHFRTFHNDQY